MKLSKCLNIIKANFIKKLNYINPDLYMKFYVKYLNSLGIKIPLNKKIGYIDPSCHFDGTNYSLIKIGEHVTISKDVLLLTHDYSINRGLYLKNIEGKYIFSNEITVGNNCFIGARSTLLPGTKIGNNVIVGAGTVIKGNIPDNSIVCGNPAKIVCSMNEWIDNHLQKKDFIKLY